MATLIDLMNNARQTEDNGRVMATLVRRLSELYRALDVDVDNVEAAHAQDLANKQLYSLRLFADKNGDVQDTRNALRQTQDALRVEREAHAEARSARDVFQKEAEQRGDQIEKLAEFIMTTIDGEPSTCESATDCAIRLLGQLQSYKIEVAELRKIIAERDEGIKDLTNRGLKALGDLQKSQNDFNGQRHALEMAWNSNKTRDDIIGRATAALNNGLPSMQHRIHSALGILNEPIAPYAHKTEQLCDDGDCLHRGIPHVCRTVSTETLNADEFDETGRKIKPKGVTFDQIEGWRKDWREGVEQIVKALEARRL